MNRACKNLRMKKAHERHLNSREDMPSASYENDPELFA
jgi:hypothetical protein